MVLSGMDKSEMVYHRDKRFEISNLDLVKDIAEVVEYMNPKE